jgi:hypothetical protein
VLPLQVDANVAATVQTIKRTIVDPANRDA